MNAVMLQEKLLSLRWRLLQEQGSVSIYERGGLRLVVMRESLKTYSAGVVMANGCVLRQVKDTSEYGVIGMASVT